MKRPKKSHIKLIILCIVVSLVSIGVGVAIYRIFHNQATIYDELTPRGKAYIEQNAQKDGSTWKDLNLEEREKHLDKRIYAGDCFSFIVPFDLRDEHTLEGCRAEVSTFDPRARFVAYQEEVAVDTIQDVPGVGFRRLKSEDYQESVKNINGKEYYIFTTTKPPVEINAFYLGDGYYRIINMLTYGVDSYTKEFEAMLGSIQERDE